MFNTSARLSPMIFTVSLLAGGCAVNGASMFGAARPAAGSSSSTASPAALGTGDTTEPDLEAYKFNLIRAEAGENAATSKACVEAYDSLIASGVAPSHPMRFRDEQGTVQTFKQKYCVDAAATAAKADEQRTAPYRAVLRGDKLAMATRSHYATAGGDYSMDPTKLAAAPVWFDSVGAPSNEKQHCDRGGKRTIVRRYQFDASHTLTKRTEQEHCGEPPASAYR
jgi:hypothetical protein